MNNPGNIAAAEAANNSTTARLSETGAVGSPGGGSPSDILHARQPQALAQTASTEKTSWLRILLGALALLVLTFAVYAPILPGSFLMDDQRLVELDNPLTSGKMKLAAIWFSSDFPLSTLGLWLEWVCWGKNAVGYHVVSIFLQALNAFLAWRLLARLRVPGAWLAAALFALHPVAVNSVARIAELKNTLSLPFVLLSFWAYLQYESAALYRRERDATSSWRGTFYLGLSLIAFVLALFSKTTVVMLPLVLLAAAAWQRGRITRVDLIHTSPYFLLSLGFGLAGSWFQKHQALVGEILVPRTITEKLALAGRAFWFYLEKTLLPLGLNIVYPRWDLSTRSVLLLWPVGLALLLFLVCWRYRRTWGRHVLFALGVFAITLFPALGFVDAQFLTKWQVSDHLQYLSLLAPLALGAAVLVWAFRNRAAITVSVVVLAALAFLTNQRARVFANEEALLRDTLAKNPAAWGAHNDLGCLLARRDKLAEALTHFETSVKLNPEATDARINLGQACAFQGRFQEAEVHFRAVLERKPFHAEAHRHLANSLSRRGREQEALPHLRAALALQANPQTRLDIAGTLYRTGDHQRAVAQLRRVVAAQPDSVEALSNLAWILATSPYAEVRDGTAAVQYAKRACELTQFNAARQVGTLAAAYAEAGNYSEAVAAAGKAISAARNGGDSRFAAMNEQLLLVFQNQKPWHEPLSATPN